MSSSFSQERLGVDEDTRKLDCRGNPDITFVLGAILAGIFKNPLDGRAHELAPNCHFLKGRYFKSNWNKLENKVSSL